MDALNRSLEPSIRAEEKVDQLLAGPAPRIRLYEWTRALRSFSPFVFLLFYYPFFVQGIPLVTQVKAGTAAAHPTWLMSIRAPFRWMITDWLFLSYYVAIPYLLLSARRYHFHQYLLFQRFARGILLTLYGGLLCLLFLPTVGDGYPLVVPLDSMGCLRRSSAGSDLCMGGRFFPAVVVPIAAFDFLHRKHVLHDAFPGVQRDPLSGFPAWVPAERRGCESSPDVCGLRLSAALPEHRPRRTVDLRYEAPFVSIIAQLIY